MVDEKYKELYPYTMSCLKDNLVKFQELVQSERFGDFFKGNFSREKVLDYFMTIHNEETLNKTNMYGLPEGLRFFHLAIPYEIKKSDGKVFYAEVNNPFYKIPRPLESRIIHNKDIKLIKDLGIFKKHPGLGDILISHGIYIAGTCKKQDLEKYNHLYSKKELAA